MAIKFQTLKAIFNIRARIYLGTTEWIALSEISWHLQITTTKLHVLETKLVLFDINYCNANTIDIQ